MDYNLHKQPDPDSFLRSYKLWFTEPLYCSNDCGWMKSTLTNLKRNEISNNIFVGVVEVQWEIWCKMKCQILEDFFFFFLCRRISIKERKGCKETLFQKWIYKNSLFFFFLARLQKHLEKEEKIWRAQKNPQIQQMMAKEPGPKFQKQKLSRIWLWKWVL